MQTDEAEAAAATEQEKADFISTLSQYYGDYQGQINTVLNDNDPTNDWQADYLSAARQQKIAEQGLDQQGNAIQTDEGLISTQVQEALQAYNAGFQTPQILEILQQAGYQFPSTGVSSYSGTGTTTTNVSPIQSNANYTALKQLLAQGRASGTEAINYIAQNEQDLVAKYGQDAVYQVYEELTQPQEQVVQEPVQEEVEDPSKYKSSADFGDDVQKINTTSDDKLESLRTTLKNNSQSFITKYTYAGYLELLSIINDRLDEIAASAYDS
jgi:hypothetical protein